MVVAGVIAGASFAAAQTFPSGLAGTYVAPIAFANDSQGLNPQGSVMLTVTATGVSSGTVTLSNGKSYGFKVTLTSDGGDGVAGRTVVVKGSIPMPGPQALEFSSIRLYSTGRLQGVLSTSLLGTPPPVLSMVAAQTVRLASYTGTPGDSAPWAGTYTIAFPLAGEASGDVPSGAGYISATVDAKAVMSFKGKLADGTALTGKALSTVDGTYTLTASPYKAGGSFKATLKLEALGDTGRYVVASGDSYGATWSKTTNLKDKSYRNGFGPLALDVEGAQWVAPAVGETLVDVLGVTGKQFELAVSGAGLDFDANYLGQVPVALEITTANALLPVFGDAYAPVSAAEWAKVWKTKVDPKTGVVTGSLILTELVESGSGTTGNLTTYTPVKFMKRTVSFEGALVRDYTSETEPFGLVGYFTIPGLAKTDPIRAGFFVAGGELEVRGTGGPVAGAIRPGTAGTYSAVVNQTIDFDLSAFNGLGNYTITRGGDPKGIPVNGSMVSFTLAPDMSSIIFNGRKVPLVADSRPTGLLFSDATAKTVKNNLTISVNLDTSTGQVIHISANYLQLLSGSMTIPTMTVNGFTIKGRTVKLPIPAFVVVTGTNITKTQ